VLRRFGFYIMLMLAGWIPFQSVAAWQMMAKGTLSQDVVISAPMSMMNSEHELAASCHDSMAEPVHHTASSDDHFLYSEHGSHCASCLSLCTGFPAASLVSNDVLPLKSVMTPAEPWLYTYVHTPSFERPPRSFIS